jgi:hypothetical protein
VFDPTIFDNIKVALEGAVYDLDFAGEVTVTSRSDQIELAAMAREYMIGCRNAARKDGNPQVTALFILSAGAADLAGEILDLAESEERTFGCTLHVNFLLNIERPERCAEIERILNTIWSYRPRIIQELSFVYSGLILERPVTYRNTVTLDFGRKINEDNIEDLFTIVEHAVQSLRQLEKNI